MKNAIVNELLSQFREKNIQTILHSRNSYNRSHNEVTLTIELTCEVQ